jgi:hypothetical protein
MVVFYTTLVIFLYFGSKFYQFKSVKFDLTGFTEEKPAVKTLNGASPLAEKKQPSFALGASSLTVAWGVGRLNRKIYHATNIRN